MVRQELGQSGLAVFLFLCEDHFADGVDAVALEEHVLRAAQADADGTESDSVGRLLGRVGIGADPETGCFRAPAHKLLEALVNLALGRAERFLDEDLDDLRRSGFDLSVIDLAGCAIDREVISLVVGAVADLERLVVVIDVERAGAANADFAHLAGDEGGMRADAAARGEDAFGRDHAAQVFGRSLDAHEEDHFTFVGGFDATFGIEVDFAGGRAGTGGEPFGNDLGRFDRVAVEDGSEDLVELLGRHAVHGGFPVDEFFFHHVAGDFHRSEPGAFAVAGLQHEELAVFDGELEVLHVFEVLLEGLLDLEELAEGRRELFFHANDGFRRAHAGHDVFTLRVDEELAVEDLGTAGRVAREGDAGTAGLAHVAEDHALHVDRRAPFVGDVVFTAVDVGALIVPRAEDRADRAHELLAGIIGESFPGALFDQGLEAFDHLLQRLGIQRGVADVGIVREKFGFEFFNDRFERLVLLARTLLHTHDDVAIHLDETAVAVVGETLIVGQTRQTLHRGVVEAEV